QPSRAPPSRTLTCQAIRFVHPRLRTPPESGGVFAFSALALISDPRMYVGKAEDLWTQGVIREMSGLNANRAPGASERSGGSERVLTWQASRAMLPLVGRIAHDIALHHDQLARMRAELA